jgi:photosystem II protein
MYLVDEEGTLETRDVNARFVNGPEAIESIYIMKSPEAWDRFMRFMERYGETNGLATKAN